MRRTKSQIITDFKLQLEELRGYHSRSANGGLNHKDVMRICHLLTGIRKMPGHQLKKREKKV